MNPGNGGWAILLTLVVALILAVFHLPEWWPQWLGWLRPDWIAMTVFFWVLAVPHRFGLVAAWLLGLVVDVLYAELAQFVRMLGLMLLIERDLQFGFVVIALASALLWPIARWVLERVQFGARVI